MAQCSSREFMPSVCTAAELILPLSRYWSPVTAKGMLVSLKSSTPANAASTTAMTSTATLSSARILLMSRRETMQPKSEISHAQKSREPSRPAHRPARRYSHARAPVSLLWLSRTYWICMLPVMKQMTSTEQHTVKQMKDSTTATRPP